MTVLRPDGSRKARFLDRLVPVWAADLSVAAVAAAVTYFGDTAEPAECGHHPTGMVGDLRVWICPDHLSTGTKCGRCFDLHRHRKHDGAVPVRSVPACLNVPAIGAGDAFIAVWAVTR